MDIFVSWASGEIIGAAAVKVFRYLSGVGKLMKGYNLTRYELKSIRSLERQISLHRQKLIDYRKNPFKYDNKGILKNATPKIQQRIINGRIKKLTREIKKFENEILKIRGNK